MTNKSTLAQGLSHAWPWTKPIGSSPTTSRLLRYSLLCMLVLLCGGSAWAKDVTATLTGANLMASTSPGTSYADYTASETFTGLKDNQGNAYFGRWTYQKFGQNYLNMVQIKKTEKSSSSRIMLPKYSGDIKKITLNVTDANSTDFSTGNGAKTQLAIIKGTTFTTDFAKNSDNQVIVKGSSSVANKTYEFDFTELETKYDGKDLYICSFDAAARIWSIEVIYSDTPSDNRVETVVELSKGYATSGEIGATLQLPTATVKAGTTVIDGASVTWESSDESVATINAEAGTISLLKKGTTSIKATYAGDDKNYLGSYVYYNVTVLGNIEDGIFDFSIGRDYGSGAVVDNSNYMTGSKTWTAGNVTMVTSGKYRWHTDNTFRIYPSDDNDNPTKLVLSVPDGNVITKIVLTGNSDISTITATSGTYANGTWTGKAQSVTLLRGTANAQIKTITVTYTSASAPEAPTFSPAAGTYYTGQYVEISCTTEGATIKKSLDGEIFETYNEAFPVMEDKTIWAYAEKNGEQSEIVSASYIIGSTYDSFAPMHEAAAAEGFSNKAIQYRATGGMVVAYVNGKNAYLIDGSGNGILAYNKDGLGELAAGQKMNYDDGYLTGTLTTYKGNAELTNVTFPEMTGGIVTVTPVEKTLPLTSANQSTLVTLKGVTYNSTDKTLSDGTNTIAFYDKFSASPTLEDGKTYDVTGIVNYNNETLQISPRTADDVVEATPTIETVHIWANVTGNEVAADDIATVSQALFGRDSGFPTNYTAVTDKELFTLDEATGKYTLSYTNVNVPADGMGISWAALVNQNGFAANDTFGWADISKAGLYDITFTYDPTATENQLTATATKKDFYIFGDPTGWELPTNMTAMTWNGETQAYEYTFTTTGTSNFCFSETNEITADDWTTFNNSYRYGNGTGNFAADDYINSENSITLSKIGGDGNIQLNTAGTWTISVTPDMKMTITGKAAETPAVEDLYVIGIDAQWNLVENMTALEKDNDGNFVLEIDSQTMQGFCFSTKTYNEDNADNWTDFNGGYRYGLATENHDYRITDFTQQYQLVQVNDKNIELTPGKYTITITPQLLMAVTQVEAYSTGYVVAGGYEERTDGEFNEVWNDPLLGGRWDTNNSNNKMTVQNDGTYKLELDNATLFKGTYGFKIVKDGEWYGDPNNNGENFTTEISQAGIYNAVFTFNPDNNAATLALTKQEGDIPVIVVGDIFPSQWNTEINGNLLEEQADGTFKNTFDFTLDAGQYKCKPVIKYADYDDWIDDPNSTDEYHNFIIDVAETGIYAVTVMLDPLTRATTISLAASTKQTSTVKIDNNHVWTVVQGCSYDLPDATVMAGETAIDGATVTWSTSNPDFAVIENDKIVVKTFETNNNEWVGIIATYAGNDDYVTSSETFWVEIMSDHTAHVHGSFDIGDEPSEELVTLTKSVFGSHMEDDVEKPGFAWASDEVMMVKGDDGKFTMSRTDVQIPSDNFGFSWSIIVDKSTEVMNGEYMFHYEIPTAGTYDITFTYDPASETEPVSVTVVRTDAEEPAGDVTALWDFRSNANPRAVGLFQGQNAQGKLDSNVQGIQLDIDATTGKFDSQARTSDAQVNNGTVIKVPVRHAGDEVTVLGNYQVNYTIGANEESVTELSKTYTATEADAQLGNVVITSTGTTYFYYIQVVQKEYIAPVTGFDNVEGSIKWTIGNETSGTVSDDIKEAIGSTSLTVGGDLTQTTNSTYAANNGVEMVVFNPKSNKLGTVESAMVEYRVKVKAGLKFKPTSVSYDAIKDGTDDATYSWSYTIDGEESQKTVVAKDDILRNNNTTGSPALTHVHNLTVDETSEFTFRIYVSGFNSGKKLALSNIIINGTVNGTIEEIPSYTLTAVASPEEGGSVKITPAGGEYEEGSTIKVTATPNFGYHFVKWQDATETTVSEDATYSFDIQKNEELTAVFTAVETYALTVNVEGGNSYQVTASPEATDGKYEAGTEVTLTAVENPVVKFTNWSTSATEKEIKVTINEDTEITANFAATDEIVAAWDFYEALGNSGKQDRAAAFKGENNDGTILTLRNAEGTSVAWLDRNYTNPYNGAICAINWQKKAYGEYYWQTKVNASSYKTMKVYSEMYYNYRAYNKYDVQYSVDGTEWTTLGTFELSKDDWSKLTLDIPEAADNKEEVYVRWIKAEDAVLDETASDNSGNYNDGIGIANIFITGTKELVDDGTAPVLQSQVPAANSENASINGQVVLTFDEKIQLTGGTKATLGEKELEPIVAGKALMFKYQGLDYDTEYTFKLPANFVSDLMNNTLEEEISFTFKTMTRPTVTKAAYDFIVPDDGTFAEAVAAANSRSDKTKRYFIFVKKGEYQLKGTGETENAEDDNHNPYTYTNRITDITASNISIIGEDRDATILYNSPDHEGIGVTATLRITKDVENTYIEDITIKNAWEYTGTTGRAVTIQDKGTRTIAKNVKLLSYQDTYYSNNQSGEFFFEDGEIHGTVDFVCGTGDVIYKDVTLYLEKRTGNVISAPNQPKEFGYVFLDCTIDGDAANEGTYYLGRPWGTGVKAQFVNTQMKVTPAAAGWTEMGAGRYPAVFAEFNSYKEDMSPIDLSGRKTSFGASDTSTAVESSGAELTTEQVASLTVQNIFGDWLPTQYTIQEEAPSNVKIDQNGKLTWDADDYALCYVVCADGDAIAVTTENSFDTATAGAPALRRSGDTVTYTVRAANAMGGLGEESAAASPATGINATLNDSTKDSVIYDLNGRRVMTPTKGVYIINGKKVVIK